VPVTSQFRRSARRRRLRQSGFSTCSGLTWPSECSSPPWTSGAAASPATPPPPPPPLTPLPPGSAAPPWADRARWSRSAGAAIACAGESDSAVAHRSAAAALLGRGRIGGELLGLVIRQRRCRRRRAVGSGRRAECGEQLLAGVDAHRDRPPDDVAQVAAPGAERDQPLAKPLVVAVETEQLQRALGLGLRLDAEREVRADKRLQDLGVPDDLRGQERRDVHRAPHPRKAVE